MKGKSVLKTNKTILLDILREQLGLLDKLNKYLINHRDKLNAKFINSLLWPLAFFSNKKCAKQKEIN